MAYQEKANKAKVKYRDLDFSFFRNPVTKDVSVKVNEEAIKASVRSLVTTNRYDRLFQPNITGGVTSKLFENITPQLAYRLKDDVEDVLRIYEPRIDLVDVKIGASDNENTLYVIIQYRLTNDSNIITQNISLDRIR